MAGDTVTGREPCPRCRESGGDDKGDNLARYDDGHGYCFSCHYYGPVDGKEPGETWERPAEEVPSHTGGLLTGVLVSLPKRGLTEETVRRYGYIRNEERQCRAAPYRDDTGRVVAQKLRFADKSVGLPWVGDSKNPRLQLFGQHLQSGGTMVIVCEGEIDAMSVSQVLGNKWPAVSIRRGAASAKKDLLEQSDWLRTFKKVVLCFDMDDAGTKAVQDCARALSPIVPVHVATLPSGTYLDKDTRQSVSIKDASDMLQAGRDAELAKAIWEAPRWRPRGILRASEVRPRVALRPTAGLSWPFPQLTALTYGRREGELTVWGAGVGCGKTDFMAACQAHDAVQHGLKTAVFSSEQMPEDILRAVASKIAGKRFNVPDGGWTDQELDDALDLVVSSEMAVYDRREDFSWPTLREHIRFLADAEGYKSFYIDNLSACVAHAADERRELDGLMEELAGLAVTHKVYVNVVSHLTTAEGKPHEEGGRVFAKHFTGSRAIARWAHFMVGLERDTQADDVTERNTVTVRVLKDRYTGQGNGCTFPLTYDTQTGLLREAPAFTPVTNEDF